VDEQLGFPSGSPASWLNRWRQVCRNLLIQAIKSAAADKDRKRPYAKTEFLGTEIIKHPTPGVTTSETSEEVEILHLPFNKYKLATWVKGFYNEPELIRTYGVTLSKMTPPEESPQDPTTSPKHHYQNDEDITAEQEQELDEAGRSEADAMLNLLENTVRSSTDPVHCLSDTLLMDLDVPHALHPRATPVSHPRRLGSRTHLLKLRLQNGHQRAPWSDGFAHPTTATTLPPLQSTGTRCYGYGCQTR